MTCAMVLYVCLGFPAGYVAARLYKSFGGEKWKTNVLLTSMLCPGYVTTCVPTSWGDGVLMRELVLNEVTCISKYLKLKGNSDVERDRKLNQINYIQGTLNFSMSVVRLEELFDRD